MQFLYPDILLARKMAAYSYAAYPDGPKPQDIKSKSISFGQFSGIIFEDDDSVTISITGTKNLANFITDARCKQVPIIPGSKIMVHYGFKECLDALWPEIEWAIRHTTKKIYLTGHSLGGAASRLILVYAKLELGITIPYCITIGEPRSLNQYGAAWVNDLEIYSLRIFNKYDIVPRVPFVTLLPQTQLFWHCNHSLWLDPEGNLDWDRPWYKKIKNDLRGLRAEFQARKGNILIGDHSAKLYVDTLNSINLSKIHTYYNLKSP